MSGPHETYGSRWTTVVGQTVSGAVLAALLIWGASSIVDNAKDIARLDERERLNSGRQDGELRRLDAFRERVEEDERSWRRPRGEPEKLP